MLHGDAHICIYTVPGLMLIISTVYERHPEWHPDKLYLGMCYTV